MPNNLYRWLTTCLLFALFVISGTFANKSLAQIFFDGSKYCEQRSESNYLEKNDGSKIFGKKISWTSTSPKSGVIKIDGEKYSISEIKGYRLGWEYFARFQDNSYLKRIVKGEKINIYQRNLHFNGQQVKDPNTRVITTYGEADSRLYYSQLEGSEELAPIKNQEVLVALLKDCPKAVAMVNKDKKDMKAALQDNEHYLNDAIDLYNDGCK